MLWNLERSQWDRCQKETSGCSACNAKRGVWHCCGWKGYSGTSKRQCCCCNAASKKGCRCCGKREITSSWESARWCAILQLLSREITGAFLIFLVCCDCSASMSDGSNTAQCIMHPTGAGTAHSDFVWQGTGIVQLQLQALSHTARSGCLVTVHGSKCVLLVWFLVRQRKEVSDCTHWHTQSREHTTHIRCVARIKIDKQVNPKMITH